MDNSMIEKSLQELDENGLSDLLKNIYSDESELDGVDDLIEESADVMV
jgi:hypothetical protein